jgi:phage/plasmid-like protein (TIGR03299 family)
MGDGRQVAAYATVRATDGAVLGDHVGPGFTVLQNSDAFAWFDPFLSSGEITLETAGSLRGGSVVWALARLTRGASVIVPKADDKVEKFLLLSNSHDGSQAVRVGFSPIRVVCANTLAMAHADGASALLRVKHTSGLAASLDAIRDCVNVADRKFEASAEQYRFLATREINAADLARYVAQVFDAPAPKVVDLVAFARGVAKESRTDRYARERSEMVEKLFRHGKGNALPGVRGTWWAAYNGITEYLQSERPRSTAETRIDSLAFGASAITSRKALALAVEMAA